MATTELLIGQIEEVKNQALKRLVVEEKPAEETKPDGTPVANYIIHYDDGTNVTIPVIYGVHSRDWFQEEANRNLKTPEAEIVYRGWAGKNFPFGLYQQVWKNPHPEKKIKTIDIVGQNSFPNFFLVGMSGEAQSLR